MNVGGLVAALAVLELAVATVGAAAWFWRRAGSQMWESRAPVQRIRWRHLMKLDERSEKVPPRLTEVRFPKGDPGWFMSPVLKSAWEVFEHMPADVAGDGTKERQEEFANVLKWLKEDDMTDVAEEIVLVGRTRRFGDVVALLYGSLDKDLHNDRDPINRLIVWWFAVDPSVDDREAARAIGRSLWERLVQEIRANGHPGTNEFEVFFELPQSDDTEPVATYLSNYRSLFATIEPKPRLLDMKYYVEGAREPSVAGADDTVEEPSTGDEWNLAHFSSDDAKTLPREETLDTMYLAQYWNFIYGEEMTTLADLETRARDFVKLRRCAAHKTDPIIRGFQFDHHEAEIRFGNPWGPDRDQ